MSHEVQDTIVALCTPPGNSARAIIRLSGGSSFDFVRRVFTPRVPLTGKRQTARGHLCLTLKSRLSPPVPRCPAIAYYMPAPASYTRENVVELQLPGSQPLIGAALRVLTGLGARLARAGEFTLRAFLNGRIDLGQAEAVERLISAESENERREAVCRMHSGISADIARWRGALTEISGTVEAALDFEENDIDTDIESSLRARLEALAAECAELARLAREERPESGGLRVVLAGLTNAGKSSLLNALLGREAALVSPETSTTRDRTVHTLHDGFVSLQVEDCPGVDAAGTGLAALVSDRARAQHAGASLLLLVVDAAAGATAELADFLRALPAVRVILALNKSDLATDEAREAVDRLVRLTPQLTLAGECATCAIYGDGVGQLRDLLFAEVGADTGRGGGVFSRREAGEIARAAEHARAAAELLPVAHELVALELRCAYECFSRACGQGYAEDILANVFSRFCIGK